MRGEPTYLLIANKASKTFIANGSTECLKLLARAFSDQFDAAIGQIADNAGNFKTGGDGFDGVAKANALHAA